MKVHQAAAFCFLSILLIACNSLSPEKTFEIAVLNSNMIVGFANDRLLQELESPSVKLVEDNKTATMQRSEVIQSKIDFSEDVLKKLKGIKETADTKEMITASTALYNYMLPVYKTEYQQLAKLYDEKASTESIQVQAQAIHDKYYQGFDALYNKLITVGKAFAQQHNITVHWAD
jgi:hypothetical protein